MRKRTWYIGGVVLVLLAIAWIVGFRLYRGQGPSAGQAVPDLILKNYSGQDVRLHSLVGKPLVINTWAAWCPFCTKELPDFAQVQKEFGDRVLVVAVNRGETLDVARRFTDEYDVSDDLLFLLDPADSFYAAIGGFSMPETIFVNVQGTIVYHKRGPMDVVEFRQRVEQLLNRS